MRVTPADWRCEPDDGTVHLEAAIEPGALTLCLWRCEAAAPGLEATLRELGLAARVEHTGPCQHEAAP